jgi:hypothetical protein
MGWSLLGETGSAHNNHRSRHAKRFPPVRHTSTDKVVTGRVAQQRQSETPDSSNHRPARRHNQRVDPAAPLLLKAHEVYRADLAVSIGGDLLDRTIGITATVDALSHLAAAEMVLEVFGQACRRAGLVEGDQLQHLLGAINVTPSAILPAA